MDSTAHWPQGIGVVKGMDQSSSKQQAPNNNMTERRATRPQKDQALNCPRCNSTNTKFCYYNNYSLTQPRYFCKTCRRYWTEGGSLRNVPVGGGSRKNKRSSSTSSSSSTISSSSSPSSNLPISKLSHPHHQTLPVQPSLNFPPKIHQGQDLNLAYPPSSSHHDHQNNISRSSFVEADPYNSTTTESHTPNLSSTGTTTTSAMELLKTGTTHGLISSFMSMPVVVDQDSNTMLISSGLIPNLAQEFKPSLSFGLHHAGYSNSHDHHHRQGYDHHRNLDQHHHAVQDQTGARLLFPSDRRQELKHVSSTTSTASDHDHRQDHHDHQFELNKGQEDISNGYTWNGMLGHGGSW